VVSEEYRRVLTAWAAEHVPAEWGIQRITSVYLDYERGGAWEYTVEDPHFQVMVSFDSVDGYSQTRFLGVDGEEAAVTMSKLLTDLFEIAEIEGLR
jgi:hypothetical protein